MPEVINNMFHQNTQSLNPTCDSGNHYCSIDQTLPLVSHRSSSLAIYYSRENYVKQENNNFFSSTSEYSNDERLCDSERSIPGYLRWATSLSCLLTDDNGRLLFKQYLLNEGQEHEDVLNFWFACEGLADDPVKYVGVIYRKFFRTPLLGISNKVRETIHQQIRNPSIKNDPTIFRAAKKEAENLIRDTYYPNFLKSDIYLQHINLMQNENMIKFENSDISNSYPSYTVGSTLATLHEDEELDTTGQLPCSSMNQLQFNSLKSFPLTKDALMLTQKHRANELRPKTEAFAGLYPHRKMVNHAYSSYNPVSRQDSELQSLSSDARTESDMSLTDNSVDGISINNGLKMSVKQHQRQRRQEKKDASINKDSQSHQPFIPRTQIMCLVNDRRILSADEQRERDKRFANDLIKKLEIAKKEQENKEFISKFTHKITSNEGLTPQILAEALKERFNINTDNSDDQDILDQHVSRVWADRTPGGQTPGITPPRTKSPPLTRRHQINHQGIAKTNTTSLNNPISYPFTNCQPLRQPKKEKDAFSTFSADSGNVHDFSEIDHRFHLPKSKSVPDYSKSSDNMYSSLPGHGRNKEWHCMKKYSCKKQEHDSGVSVISEAASVQSMQSQCKDSRVMTWLIENNSNMCSSPSEHDAALMSSGCARNDLKHKVNRGRRSPPSELRLDDSKNKSRQRCSVQPQKPELTNCSSMNSTLQRKSVSLISPYPSNDQSTITNNSYTIVVFSFCDEQVPYRSRIPGQFITLRQFKEYLPKKGNYRYYFKTECDDPENPVIQELITDDNKILPLWEGKVMAQVTPFD